MKRAPSTSAGTRYAAIAGIAIVVGVLAVHWYVSRARARRGAADTYSAAVTLAACVLDRAPPQQAAQITRLLAGRVELAFATSRPLAACGDAAHELGKRAAAQRAAIYHRSPEDVATLASVAGDLARFPWNDTANTLATSLKTAHVGQLLGRALAVGCDVAVAENVFGSPPCPRAGPTRVITLPPPHGALGVALGAPVGDVRWSATSRADTLALAVSGTSLARRVTGSWLSVRRGTGPWKQIDAETARSAGDAAFVAPTIGFDGATPAFVLDGQGDAGGAWHGVISKLDLPHSGATRVESIDALPAGLLPVATGTRLLVVDHAPALALGPAGDAGSARGVLLFPSKHVQIPPGRVVAAWQSARARVALVRDGASGLELAAFDVPAPGSPWPAPIVAPLPGATHVAFDAESATVCGDRFLAAARDGARAWLVDIDAKAARVAPVAARPGTRLHVVCGACAPELFEQSDTGLRLLSGDGKTVRDVPLPVAADVAARRTASAACTPAGLFVAYIARGTLLVQRANEDGTFAEPVPIAAQTHDGAPIELRLLAVGDRAVAMWRRAKRGTRDIALEYVESSDGVVWR